VGKGKGKKEKKYSNLVSSGNLNIRWSSVILLLQCCSNEDCTVRELLF
jgi:hypothetical protein